MTATIRLAEVCVNAASLRFPQLSSGKLPAAVQREARLAASKKTSVPTIGIERTSVDASDASKFAAESYEDVPTDDVMNDPASRRCRSQRQRC